MKKNTLIVIAVLLFFSVSAQKGVVEIKSYAVEKAKQGIAVDELNFYVINNDEIVKYLKTDGEKIITWKDTTGTIKHLNSGVVINDQLYCANSNYPESPMVSSIEIFDTKTLKHIGNHSFGIDTGSATWIDWYEKHWYVVFAHYTGKGSESGNDNNWTQLVKFTENWQRVEGWIFPKSLIEKFGDRSNSGGFFTDTGIIYITGHDNKELYMLELPEIGYTLKWVKTLLAPFEGQGVALDPIDDSIIYGIIRSKNQVIKAVLKK